MLAMNSGKMYMSPSFFVMVNCIIPPCELRNREYLQSFNRRFNIRLILSLTSESYLIISMTKLLNADCFREVQ